LRQADFISELGNCVNDSNENNNDDDDFSTKIGGRALSLS